MFSKNRKSILSLFVSKPVDRFVLVSDREYRARHATAGAVHVDGNTIKKTRNFEVGNNSDSKFDKRSKRNIIKKSI